MTLLFLLLLLVAPYLLLTLVGSYVAAFKLAPSTRARVGLSLFFVFTAVGHFIRPDEMSAMLPTFVPYRVEIIYLTGILELLGAMGVWIPRLVKLAGFCLILMLIGILPTNIYSAANRVDFGGHGSGLIYLLIRVPFQVFVIGWIYFTTEQKWFARKLKEA
ncbi:MAG: DoxX family protein [Ferruginibacter sp.]|nr:DoxX family protein [Cytophagales bacterium]